MSLVQRIDPAKTAAESVSAFGEQIRASGVGLDKPNVSLLRRFQSENRGLLDLAAVGYRGPEKPAPKAAERRPTGDGKGHSAAINLIDEVSSMISFLIEENDGLHASVKKTKDRAEADLERATLVACEWRKSAESSKLRLDTLEQRLAEMTARAERAEAVIAAEKELALKSAQEAAEAECLSSLFEEKLLMSFGEGSSFRKVMETIRNRADTGD